MQSPQAPAKTLFARWVPTLVTCVLFGCACGATDGSPHAHEDASTPGDSGGRDAGPITSDGAPMDIGVPAILADSGVDAQHADADGSIDIPFECDSCAAPGPCESLSCEGSCEYRVAPDGQSCGDGVCVEGACVERRCGDGWRERGDTFAPREACDDGNELDDDGCTNRCDPRAIVVSQNNDGHREWTTRGAAAAALDDEGNLLVVWSRERPDRSDATAVLARRFDHHGQPIDEQPLHLESVLVGDSPDPTVIGLAHGWLVAWTSREIEGSDGFGTGIASTIISLAGEPTELHRVNDRVEGAQRRPTLARLASGYAIAWEHQHLAPVDVHARLFGTDGAALGPSFVIAGSTNGEGAPRAVAIESARWAVGWIDAAPPASVRLSVLEGSTVQRTMNLYSGAPDQLALDADAERIVIAIRDAADNGTIGAGSFLLDQADIDPTFDWTGSAREESDAAATMIDGGQLTLYRTAALDSDRGALVSSPGASAPPEISVLQDALRSSSNVERFSISRTRGGWVFAWTARTIEGAAQICALRLAR